LAALEAVHLRGNINIKTMIVDIDCSVIMCRLILLHGFVMTTCLHHYILYYVFFQPQSAVLLLSTGALGNLIQPFHFRVSGTVKYLYLQYLYLNNSAPRHNKEVCWRIGIWHSTPRLWTELPVNIRSSGTLSMFRKCLKTSFY